MEKGYSHTFRFAVISVLMAGFVAHLALPFSSHAQKTAFTQWLDHNVVATGDENEIKLRDTIRKLPERSNDFWVLIQEASDLVASHQDDFRLRFSLSETDNTQHNSSWLVGQWNVFQLQKTGSNAVIPEIPHQINKWISSNQSFSGFFSRSQIKNRAFIPEINRPTGNGFLNRMLTPLAGGISINAP